MKFAQLCAISALVACSGGTPTNFAGAYTLTTTENANNCNIASWTPGSTATFQATFTQDGANAQINIQGAAAIVFDYVVGVHTFAGSVSGNEFTSEYIGTKSTAAGACSYTYNITIDAKLDSNSVLSGTVTITPVTNNDPSCGVLNACSNTETVSGNRTGP